MEQKVFFALAKDPSPASKKRKQESDTVFTAIKWSKTYPEWMPIQVLPAEMLCRVFAYLPLKDKCCMSLVCSYWKSLIDETLALLTSLDLSSESPLRFADPYRPRWRSDRLNAIVLFFAFKCKNLHLINLEGCNMLSADAIHSLITSSLKVSRPSLKFLFLADCHLPSQTLRLIATQCGNRLKQLDLFRASLDPHDPDQDLEDLFSGCKSLRYLNLCNLLCNTTHYRIDASILDQLASGMPKLQTLYVDLSRMSEVRANQFVEKFQATHPKAIIRQYGRSQAYDYLYIGEQNWKGEQHGKGKTVWHTGTTYEGDWREGRMHGVGICHWQNGQCYSGEWKLGAMDGKGVYTYSNGDKFEGTFHKGKKYGRLYSFDGTLIREEAPPPDEGSEEGTKKKKIKRKKKDYHIRIPKPSMF